jgi:uncharacterized protein YbjT (DUF2867 family)
MPGFMENLLHQVHPLRAEGVFYGTLPAGRRSPTVATRDIAATSARLLLDDTWTGAGEVACLGPADLSPTEMAQVICDVLGREVRYRQISAADFKERMMGFGMTDAMAQGLDNALARTPESTTPTTFRQWCEEVLAPAVGV